MISESGKKILEKFVVAAKTLLMNNVTEQLQQFYGIWADGHTIRPEELSSDDMDVVHTARMLRERLNHILASLPESNDEAKNNRLAASQLISEQAFTQLNRFAALRMCEERDLIFESVRNGENSVGFQSYDMVASRIKGASTFERYKWYLSSVFDELAVELPAVFGRFSPYALVFPDETTLHRLLDLINDEKLSNYYDEQSGTFVNFWNEDETLGWMFQYYNSLEERRKMRDESTKPRNSREMAVRNQFFTPEYVVRFLTDNSLGRIWHEMTRGESHIGEEQCTYMVRRPGETYAERAIKEPTEILSLDPTCGSMHFGLYLYEVYEYIYRDAWDNHPELLQEYRARHSRESFLREVPCLILEKNIHGCEIDPRALQIAALSLWLRAQRSFKELGIEKAERPTISRSNLVLAESMPGNRRLLKGLMQELEKPMQQLLTKIREKMNFVGEAGLLYKMEKEIAGDIEELKKNWSKITYTRERDFFDSPEERAQKEAEYEANKFLRENKAAFFAEIARRLRTALASLAEKMSEEEGYENALFTEDATRGLAFIELCQKRFDCIVMNPPFGEGSENTTGYLNNAYPAWCKNLVCAFFDRMQEMLTDDGRLGAIFDRTVLIKSSYEDFRKRNICGFITACADTGWDVLDANVETSTLVVNKNASDVEGVFIDVQNVKKEEKNCKVVDLIHELNNGGYATSNFISRSKNFVNLPNAIVGYYFGEDILKLFLNGNLETRNFVARQGYALISDWNFRLYYEFTNDNQIHSLYNGGNYSLFYSVYRDCIQWVRDGIAIKAHKSFRNSGKEFQLKSGVGYGKRGDILDAHILKEDSLFSVEGMAIPDIGSKESKIVLGYLNSILGQYAINLYSAQHKQAGNMNLLPMPDYETRQDDITRIVNEIIEIKRWWFSLDETNLEYRGLIGQLKIAGNVGDAFERLQEKLTRDYARYCELVKENDDLWMDLAGIEEGSDFRKTLNDYKVRRPYENLLSIDDASEKNVIDKKVLAAEIVQELVGLSFGRWDVGRAKNHDLVAPFGDVFDALPFMPVVSLGEVPAGYELDVPGDGILSARSDAPDNLAARVREAIHAVWREKGDDVEYELTRLLGVDDLQEYLNAANGGFFDHHFMRYKKSRRIAPIYWPVSTADGEVMFWVYYPKMSAETLPALVLKLKAYDEQVRSRESAAAAGGNKVLESELAERREQVRRMIETLNDLIERGYVPNHDDGVPVTAAPLAKLFAPRAWRRACEENLALLDAGEYDWSHLAYALYPARVTAKAKKDWCLALTHSLEHLCENRPKEKKPKKAKKSDRQMKIDFTADHEEG